MFLSNFVLVEIYKLKAMFKVAKNPFAVTVTMTNMICNIQWLQLLVTKLQSFIFFYQRQEVKTIQVHSKNLINIRRGTLYNSQRLLQTILEYKLSNKISTLSKAIAAYKTLHNQHHLDFSSIFRLLTSSAF